VKALALALCRHPRFCDELTPDNIELLFKSAPLHDIGKVGIPDRILLKPGMLDREEFEIMKTHTTLGRDAIRNAEAEQSMEMPFLRFAKEITQSHQEKWDGSGYPEGLIGELIPVSARLMAVADVYDALISKRAYKAAFTHDKATEIITNGAGSHFDPDVVEAFIGIAEDFRTIAQRYIDDDSALAHQVNRLAADMPSEHIELDSKI
jgi:putative two-component system response regulator